MGTMNLLLYTYPAGYVYMFFFVNVANKYHIFFFPPSSPAISARRLRVKHRRSSAGFQVSSDEQGWSNASAFFKHCQSQQQKWWEEYSYCRNILLKNRAFLYTFGLLQWINDGYVFCLSWNEGEGSQITKMRRKLKCQAGRSVSFSTSVGHWEKKS